MEEQLRSSPRRQILRITHKRFQLSFLFFSFGIGAITTITAIIAMQMMNSGLSESAAEIRNLDWDQIELLLNGQMQKATWLILAVSVINLLVTGILSLYFSQHVAGIVFRMTATLRQWSSGEPVQKITPRKGDFFIELVDEVNEVIKEPKK